MRPTRVPSIPILLVAFFPFLCGACGLLFTKGPPAGYENMSAIQCTESTTLPVLDVVFGALNLIGSIAFAEDTTYFTNSGQAVASGVIWTVISGISAGVGFDRVKKCVAAKRAVAERPGAPPTAPVEDSRNVGLKPVRTVLIMGGRDTLSLGEQVQFVAKAFDSVGTVILGRTFAWSSSNDAIASVGNTGLVTTHAVGGVVIAANTDNVVGTEKIVVVSTH